MTPYTTTYPEDYQAAMSNILADEELTHLLNKPGCAPRFVFGNLMLPTVLKHYIDEDQTVEIHRRMTRATVSGYELFECSTGGMLPAMRRCEDPSKTVEGMLVLGLNETQRNDIYELESGLADLVTVEARVHVHAKDGRYMVKSERTVDAGAFVWSSSTEELVPLERRLWPVDRFLKEQFYQSMVMSQRIRALEDVDRSSRTGILK